MVVVPGMMGTRLRITANVKGVLETRIWDPDNDSVMTVSWGSVDSIEMRNFLHHTAPAEIYGHATDHSPEQISRGWSALPNSYYGAMLRSLAEHHLDPAIGIEGPVYAFGYDWRQDNAVSAEKLVDFAHEVIAREDAEGIAFVTHSMGGYVVRQAFEVKGESNRALRMKTVAVVHIGQPVMGAPVAYRRHLTGTKLFVDGPIMYGLMGGEPEDTLRIFSAMPSAMQLLPSDGMRKGTDGAMQRMVRIHRGDGGDSVPYLFPGAKKMKWLYDQKVSPPGLAKNLRFTQAIPDMSRRDAEAYVVARKEAVVLVERAEEFHEFLRLRHHPATWTISANGVLTDTWVVFRHESLELEGVNEMTIGDIEIAMGRTSEGDGTVPNWSAEALIPLHAAPATKKIAPALVQQYRVAGVEHDDLCVHRSVLDVLFQLVDFVLKAPPWVLGLRVRGLPGLARRQVLALFKSMTSAGRSAAIELRVARWLAESGKHVVVNPEPDDGVSRADLTVNGLDVDVKYSDSAGEVRLREHIAEGFKQADEVILVRGTDAKLTPEEYETIGRDVESQHPGKVLTIIAEAKLPPWEWGF